MSEFQGKTVLVTGVASGIGKAQAYAFLDAGAEVIGVDCQKADFEHPYFKFYLLDITDEQSVSLLKELNIDILCNTAGVLDDFLPTLETDYAMFQRVMAVNVTGLYLVTNAVLPQMLNKKQGVIINMASIASLIPGGGGASYTASKHAVYGYTKQLAYDYAHQGIRVNALAPGAVNTPMVAADFAGDGKIAQAVISQVPQKRYATPEEIADVTLFIASDAARYICGDIIPIDGGWINRNMPL